MRFLPLLLIGSFVSPIPVGAQNPSSTQSQPTRPAPAGQPFTEVQFYRLLQENQGRSTITEDIERALRERGIGFEATDAILDSARELGATPRIIAALVKADAARKSGNPVQPSAAPDKPRVPPPPAPTDSPTPTTQSPTAPPSAPRRPREPILGRQVGKETTKDPEQRVADRVHQRITRLPLLDQAREFALASLNELPDFLADQTIRRSTLIRGAWQHRDLLETTVSYEQEVGEKIRLVSVDGQPTAKTYDDIGGTTNVGTFSWHVTAPFQPAAEADFQEAGSERYRGRDCAIFRYKVLKKNSKYQLRAVSPGTLTQTAVVGFSGRMWIDRETKYVLRVEMVAEEIPTDFPMSHSEVVVDYDWVSISGRRFWMPVNAEAVAEFPKQGQTFLNVIDFRNYRKFEGEIQVVD